MKKDSTITPVSQSRKKNHIKIDVKRLKTLEQEEIIRYKAERPRSLELLNIAKRTMPCGVPNSWMAGITYPFPIFVKEGKGAYFTDVDGHRYLDFEVG